MNWQQHLPVLQVVVPLMAAPLAALLRQRTLAYAVALAASWVALVIALALWRQVDAAGTLSYAIGNWPPPWGIEYRVDRLTALVLLLVAGIGALVVPYSRRSIGHELAADQHDLFHTLLLLCLAGLLGIVITGDAFNIFVFLEVSSLASYVLIAMGRDRRALVAAYQYLIMGTIGATFIVIGIGLLYLMTGTLNLADMARRLAPLQGTRPVLAALAFLTVGISLKLALFPLHAWLPSAYGHAPSAVSALLAATATKVAVYVLLRFYFTVFGGAAVFGSLPMQGLLMLLALVGLFGASAVAVLQSDLKRLFAYSSVGQVGYIVLGLALHSSHGLTGALVHLVGHGITKGAVFMLLGGVAMVMGGTSLARVQGLGQRMPLTSAGIVVCGLSLIGVPGTVGFVSKWYLLLAAIEKGQWWLAFLIVASSLLAVAYVWRFVEAAYLKPPRQDLPTAGGMPLGMAVPAALLVAGTVWLGLDGTPLVNAAQQAAELLLKGPR